MTKTPMLRCKQCDGEWPGLKGYLAHPCAKPNLDGDVAVNIEIIKRSRCYRALTTTCAVCGKPLLKHRTINATAFCSLAHRQRFYSVSAGKGRA